MWRGRFGEGFRRLSAGRDGLLHAAGAAALFGVLALVYGYAVRLPLFLDDPVHFRWLEGQSFGDVWRSAQTIGYYRPLTFTIWKVLRLLQGGYRPGTLHAVNVLLHGTNALLLMTLLWRRGEPGDRLVGWAAGLLFLLFPFSYQAVPWVGSLSHILATALTLGALNAHLAGRRGLGLVLAALAPFAHETGVLVAPLLALLLWTRNTPHGTLRSALRDTAGYWGIALVGLAVWAAVPKGVGETGLLNLESRWQNAAYFGQGLIFPVAPLARMLLAATTRLNDLQCIAAVAVPAVAVWTLLLARAGQGRLALAALGWYAVAIAPAWLVLGFEYVVDGPRLMYGASAGAALFWAAALGALSRAVAGGKVRRWETGTAAAGVAAVVAGVWVGGGFLASRDDLYLQMGYAVEGLVRAARALPPGQPLVAINVPWWIAPRSTTFALGHEGVTLVPPYATSGDLLWLHTGEERPVEALVVGRLRQEWRYWMSCAGTEVDDVGLGAALRRAGGAAVVSAAGQDLHVIDAGRYLSADGAPGVVWLASYEGLRLVDLEAESTRDGLSVVLTWECLEPPQDDVTVFLHAVDADGSLLGQMDGYPLAGASPPRGWSPGDVWRDVRAIRLPDGASAAALRVGLYRPSDGGRITARDPAGSQLPDDAFSMALGPPG